MKNSIVSVVIVNYNGIHLLNECFQSIQESSYQHIEVIVVDNGSTDGSVDYIKKKKIKNMAVKIIANEHNLGFAKANNQGEKIATGEYILLLNNDAFLTEKTIEILASSLKGNNEIAVVQPKIIFSKTKKLQSGAAFLTPFGFLYYFGFGHNADDKCYNKTMDIFSANGACILIKRSIIKKAGLFDDSFFAYYEETDFCHRVLLSGKRVVYVPKTTVFHKGGQTAMILNQSFIFFHAFKNRLNSTLKNFERGTLARMLVFLFAIYVFLLLSYLIRGKLKMSAAIFSAVLWNVINFGKTLEKRKAVQYNIRAVPDKVYFNKTLRNVSIRYYYNMFLNKEVLLEEEKY